MIDRIVLRRVAGSVLLTLSIFFGLVVLVELITPRRYLALLASDGPGVALLALFARAGRWVLDTLQLILLIGTIAGLIRLTASREMTIIKAAGHSIWRIMRGPLLFSLAVGIVAAALIQPAVVSFDRRVTTGAQSALSPGSFFLEESGPGFDYVFGAETVLPGGTAFEGISIFGVEDGTRLRAERARLEGSVWALEKVTRLRAGQAPERLQTLSLPASTRPGDIAARLGVLDDSTIYELGSVVQQTLSDPVQRARTLTRLARLATLPLALMGSVVIAFAFTAGYRRVNRYGSEMLYGILVGFVVYVVGELAGRAGYAGALQPLAAVLAPAGLALLAGATVLLFREDGLR